MAKYKVKTKDSQLMVRVKLSSQEKISESQLERFSSKEIRGLLKARQVRKRVIEYSGPIGIRICERLQKPISKYEFFFIMEQIVDIVQEVNRHALIINNLIFDIKHVFIIENTKEIQFLYLPLEQAQSQTDIIDFIENIIYSATPAEGEDREYMSRFVYFIKGLRGFDADRIEKFIQAEDQGIVDMVKRHGAEQGSSPMGRPANYVEEDAEKTNFMEEETGFMNTETELIDESDQFQYATLYRVSTDETIGVNKAVFRLGRERSYSDYSVGNNGKVSKSHTDIIVRDQRFFVMDLDSKNGTYVNGKKVPVRQEVEIFHGDSLSLADEEFEFRTTNA